MVGLAPATGYGAVIEYGGTNAITTPVTGIRYASVTSASTIPVRTMGSWGIDYATGDSVTNWLEVEQEWGGVYDPQSGWVQYHPKPKTMAERIKEIIAARNAPAFITNRKALDRPHDIRELRARETLCRVIGEEKYRRFLVQGHVTARAKSGLVYQIFPGHGITSVYDKGKMVERLCVVLRGDFPPTDSLIMRYLMILNNEENFRSYAIKHHVPQSLWPENLEQIVEDAKKNSRPKTLAEIYSDIKTGKHARIGEVAAHMREAA